MRETLWTYLLFEGMLLVIECPHTHLALDIYPSCSRNSSTSTGNVVIVLAETRYCGVKNTDTPSERQDMKHAFGGHNKRSPAKDSRVELGTEANLHTPDNHIGPRAISNHFSI